MPHVIMTGRVKASLNEGLKAMATTTETKPRGLPRIWRITLWAAIAGLLLLPAVATRTTTGFNWTATDFVFAGVLLIGAGVLFEIAMWTLRTPLYRVVAGFAILGLLLTIWAEAAVGIFH